MKTNLSSQIKLDRIPRRYYNPDSEIELTALRRQEKIDTRVYETAGEGADFIVEKIAKYIARFIERRGKCVLALGAGNSTHIVYNALIKKYKEGVIDFDKVVVFNISEFFPLRPDGPSTLTRLHQVFLDQVNVRPENIHSIDPATTKEAMSEYCNAYEQQIADEGGIDVALCEIAPNGAIAFNEPGSQPTSYCRLVLLGNEMRHKVEKDYNCDDVPTTAITLGLSNFISARRLLCMAWGENNANIIKEVVEGPATNAVPASLLQGHPHVKVVTDLAGAEELTRISQPWKVTSCDWNDKLMRRAIVWLSNQTGKPILKLTDKDYNDWGLGELLALYGSAYNVNIKIFNDLQHTITGWPGGKPDADDTTRPAPSAPFPKRVVIFSPHPDDDVISMGGTFIRLVQQGHDVHVAYQTSGNVAVHDDVVLQNIDTSRELGFGDRFAEAERIIASKRKGEPEPRALLDIKGAIRRAEARAAVRSFGLNPDTNAHFLNMPFYETGGIKKGSLAERDIALIVDLLRRVRPHQIYAAGDLADPHGTHRICTEAVLEALDVVRSDDWLRECHLWLYRGAWLEWDLGMVDMAVPLSPDEMLMKRHAIYRHLSQKDIMPFPGSDTREFWQRAEERTQHTAQLYDALGMAEYQAIEVFVKMF